MPEEIILEGKSNVTHLKDGIIDLAAGTAGGIANVYAGQPLDTVKVKMQAFPQFYNNWTSCFVKTFNNDGIRGLYAGTTPALIANIAENAVLFTAYGYCQKLVAAVIGCEDPSSMKPIHNAFAGSTAAVFAAGVLCPTELVKCRLQAQTELNPHIKRNAFGICSEMYKQGGVRSFFIGMTPTLTREVPGYFAFFGAYEFTRYLFTPEGKSKDDIGLAKTAVSGAVGGSALWTLVFPADVIKSRMQVTGEGTFGSVFISILKHEGPIAFYRGLTPTLIRTCSASGCLFIAYENTKRFLHSL
uniref:Mitochondrial ornithine transporter 1 n=1 Tax=Panagrolaimus superbus TaxID=310955 RepID=A0A914YNB0_9BILA